MAEVALKNEMFVWEGKDKTGKTVRNEMSGASEAQVKAMLRRQGINPTRVRKKPKPLFGSGGGKKIVPKDIAVFSRQMATMMSSGATGAIVRDRRAWPRKREHAATDPQHQSRCRGLKPSGRRAQKAPAAFR